MDQDQIIVISVILGIAVSLYTAYLKAPVAFLLGVIVLSLTGILTPKEILIGFSNEQIAVILLLLILGDVIQKTGILNSLFEGLFRKAKSYKGFLWRMMLYVSASSAFLNNTPLVAMVMPYANNWAEKHKISPSKLLIPLSYASILGGAATLIGTSTNLLMNGLVVEFNALIAAKELIINSTLITRPLEELGIFDFTVVGVPMIILGLIYFLTFGHKLLPSNKSIANTVSDTRREYIVETLVASNSCLVDKSIEDSNLRNLDGLYIVEIIRENRKISSVGPKAILEAGDILLLAGDTEKIGALLDKNLGLTLPEKARQFGVGFEEMLEVVIPYNSIFSSKSVKGSNFRAKLDASIVAIHRNGEKISGKIGEIIMQPGDLLMLLCGQDFNKRIEGNSDLYVISQKTLLLKKVSKIKAFSLLGGLFIAVLLSSFNMVPLFQSLLFLLGLIVLTKTASLHEVKKSMRFNILVIAGMSLAIGRAMMKTGAADLLATQIVELLGSYGSLGILFGLYFITNVMAAYLTNVASLAIMLPIALGAAFGLELPFMPFVLVIAFASAANFITPIGYQTNLMVFGPGRYTFGDYMKVGFPISMAYMIVAVFILNFIYL